MSPKEPEAEFSSADFICPDSTCTMTNHPGVFQRGGTDYCVCLSYVHCHMFHHGNWTTAYSRTEQLIKQPWFASVLLKSDRHFSLFPHGPVWLLSCPPSLVSQKKGCDLCERRRELLEEATLQALAICPSFLLPARRQVTKAVIYSPAPSYVLNHLVPWIRLGRQPWVFSWVLLRINSSGFNTNDTILISDSERTFSHSLRVNKTLWLRIRTRKLMLFESVLWLPQRG